MFKNILACSDGSEPALRAARAAADVAGKYQASVTVLTVLDAGELPSLPVSALQVDSMIEKVQEGHAASEEVARAIFAEANVPYQHRYERGDAAAVIVATAADARFDLIVIGHRGQNAMMSVLQGSVSSGVARLAPCPVLLIP